MRRASPAGALPLAIAMLARAALAQPEASPGSTYAEEHVQPRIAGVLSEFLKKPI